MGNFKKALNYSMDDNDQKSLNDLILNYIARKEDKREAEVRNATVLEVHNMDSVLKLNDDQIYNTDDIKDPLVQVKVDQLPDI